MYDLPATLALVLFPILVAILFARLPFNRAVLWTLLIAQLLLPVGAFIKFDQVPQLDKNSIPSICLAGAVVWALRDKLRFEAPKSIGIVGVLVAMFLVGPIITSGLNGETLRYGRRILPGVGWYDAVSALIASIITIIPYFVGRELLRNRADSREILRVLVLSMLVYSIPLLLEARLSPQLHYWIYGTYPSMFLQSIRGGGYRPMVFMGHGLILAHFVLLAFIAAIAFWRTGTSVAILSRRGESNYRLVAGYLAVILTVCRTLGAALYGMVLAPLILHGNPKLLMRLSVVLVVLSLTYPPLRYFDLVPTQRLVEISGAIDGERADSLAFRFYNEQLLLDRAVEKPVFGWGRYGRNRVYDETTGDDLVLTDGEWAIVLGQFGAVGFIAEFGLLSIAVFRAAAAFRFIRSSNERIYFASLTAIVAVSIFDLLPNAFLTPWTFLITGALLGRAEALQRASGKLAPERSAGLVGNHPWLSAVPRKG